MEQKLYKKNFKNLLKLGFSCVGFNILSIILCSYSLILYILYNWPGSTVYIIPRLHVHNTLHEGTHHTHTLTQLYFLVVEYICYLCFSKHRSNNHSHAHNLLAVSIELEVRSVTVKLLSITRSSRIERHTVLLGSSSPIVIVLLLRTSSTRSVFVVHTFCILIVVVKFLAL